MHKFIWIVFIISVLIIAPLYFILTSKFIKIDDSFRIHLPLIIEIFGSLIFAFIIFLTTSKLEEHWRKNTHKDQLKNDLNLLKKEINRVFKRNKSTWNFMNTTAPNFYLDDSSINPLYDLLSANNRKNEAMLLDYQHSFKISLDHPVQKLLNFLDDVEEILILGEKIDSHFKHTHIAPSLAASKDSNYRADTDAADNDQFINLLIYRSQVVEISKDNCLFGIALIPNITSLGSKLDHGILKFQDILKQNNALEELIFDLRDLRIRLIEQTTTLKELFKNK